METGRLACEDKIYSDGGVGSRGSNANEKKGIGVCVKCSNFSWLKVVFKEPSKVWCSFNKNNLSSSGNPNCVIIGLPEDEKLLLLKENQTLIGSLNTNFNKEKLENLKKNKINCFSLELLPRITRAQSMDILSSQANLAGYKAVIEAFQVYERAIPMMMTAAGTIPAAKVLVVGAGVAGLQAIAPANRMDTGVFTTDVRMTSKKQVERLGGKCLPV